MPRAALILPLIGEAGVVERALRAALAQSCDDYEVIAVDVDDRPDMRRIAEIFASDRRLRMLSLSSKRMADARNASVRAARSPLLAFLRPGETWPRMRLGGHLRHFASDSRVGVSVERAHKRSGATGSPPRRLTAQEVCDRADLWRAGYFVRRSAINEVGRQFPLLSGAPGWFRNQLGAAAAVDLVARVALSKRWKVERIDPSGQTIESELNPTELTDIERWRCAFRDEFGRSAGPDRARHAVRDRLERLAGGLSARRRESWRRSVFFASNVDRGAK